MGPARFHCASLLCMGRDRQTPPNTQRGCIVMHHDATRCVIILPARVVLLVMKDLSPVLQCCGSRAESEVHPTCAVRSQTN